MTAAEEYYHHTRTNDDKEEQEKQTLLATVEDAWQALARAAEPLKRDHIVLRYSRVTDYKEGSRQASDYLHNVEQVAQIADITPENEARFETDFVVGKSIKAMFIALKFGCKWFPEIPSPEIGPDTEEPRDAIEASLYRWARSLRKTATRDSCPHCHQKLVAQRDPEYETIIEIVCPGGCSKAGSYLTTEKLKELGFEVPPAKAKEEEHDETEDLPAHVEEQQDTPPGPDEELDEPEPEPPEEIAEQAAEDEILQQDNEEREDEEAREQ